MTEEYAQTEFNSSWACLVRIDNLIQMAHRSSMGMVLEFNNPLLFCHTLLRIYMEGKDKFSKEENERCMLFENKFLCVLQYNSNDMRITIPPLLRLEAHQFEKYLMSCLENHNMLMANIQKEDRTPGIIISENFDEDLLFGTKKDGHKK